METEKARSKMVRKNSKKIEKQKQELQKKIDEANAKVLEAQRLQQEAKQKAEAEQRELEQKKEEMEGIQHQEDIKNPSKFTGKVISVARELVNQRTQYLSYEDKQWIKDTAKEEAVKERRKLQTSLFGLIIVLALVFIGFHEAGSQGNFTSIGWLTAGVAVISTIPFAHGLSNI